ncbi:GNAT family N-acetyltransferase [Altererythrobacter sp. ZODW24]|uniref:GNAT family N-acetyltransferase n=1 Tax=Altererythrobacter sp. ZODW24 TaxID=2185142 RepID=UPI000DF7EC5D|nr:GNAT family N-acetyltransferase [Altererythrobacter sp. ZODW24]
MSETDWSIRLAKLEDAEHLPDIELAAGKLFETIPDLAGIAGGQAIPPERHRKLIVKGHCLVAASGERIAGFLASEPFGRELHITELSVHPDFQQQGIGARLMRGCQIDAHNSGFSALTLTTFRNVPWNGPFYRRLGFVEVEELDSHARLRGEIAKEVSHGLPEDQRAAMIRFLS